MAEYKQLYQSSCMIDHTKQVLASMLQHQPLDNSSKSIHKFLQFTCQTLLAPSHFALFSPHELQTLVIANLSVHGITAIQSLLDALVSCGSNAPIHLQNIAHVLSALFMDEKWMERVLSERNRGDEIDAERVVRIFMSIPEKVLNSVTMVSVDDHSDSPSTFQKSKSAMQNIPPSLEANRFYSMLIDRVLKMCGKWTSVEWSSIIRSDERGDSNVQSADNSHLADILLQMISLMARRGQTKLIASRLIHFVGHSEVSCDHMFLYHILQFLQFKMDAMLVQKIVFALLDFSNHSVKIQEALRTTFTESIKSNDSYRSFFCDKVWLNPSIGSLVDRSLDLSVFLTSIILNSASEELTQRTLVTILNVWKEEYFIKHSTQIQQTFLTNSLLLLLDGLSGDMLQGSSVLSMCLKGIQNRLGSSIPIIQCHANMLAEKTSQMMNPSNIVTLFDEFRGELQKFETNARSIQLTTENDIQSMPNNELDEISEHKENSNMSESDDELDADELFDPSRPFRMDEYNDDATESSDSSEEGDEQSDTESDSSFEAQDLEDDTKDLAKIQPPKYLHDLLAYLRTSSSDVDIVDKYEVALNHAESLIRRSGESGNNRDLFELTTALSQILLHMNESYNIENFDIMRIKALVAIGVHSTEKLVKYLTKEYYSNSVNLSHKHMILNVLSEVALELSNRSERKPTAKSPIVDQSDTSQQYPSRTRRWGRKTVEDEAKPNLFLKYAPLFFYPFIREDYTYYHKLLSGDSYLVSRLIRTCGVFVYCCGTDMTVGYDMARTLLNFAWMVRFQMNNTGSGSQQKQNADNIALLPHHIKEDTSHDSNGEAEVRAATAVRQSVLTAILQCLMSLSGELLIENYLEQMDEMISWLISESEFDADNECREIAKTALQVLQSKINHSSGVRDDL